MKKLYILLLFFCVTANFIIAQTRTYTTKRVSGEVPRIDGNFDDAAWDDVIWENNFTQFEPNNGEEPSQQTEFKILYDDNNIYVAIKALDTEADKIVKRMCRRDVEDGDMTGIFFDSYYDKRTSFGFMVNAAGVKYDAIITADGDNMDESWDAIWFVKTKVHSMGWNAEMQIPLSQLRFNSEEIQSWGLEVTRMIYRHDELSFWQAVSKDKSGLVSHFGKLLGIKNIKPKKQVEVAPYIMGKYENYEKEEGNPFADGSGFGYNAGVDGKIGITNDLILDFAINPDFGQVEADPSEVNLSAYETFFNEKRPFFIEGNNITDYGITPGGSPWSRDNLLYSRRIGKSPHRELNLEDDEYADIPGNSKILGAFKLTGKTKNGWSVGIIESFTNKEKATVELNGERRKEIVEPYTNYLIGRVQKDINKGNTIVGGMITSTYRNINDENLLFLNKIATTGGIDFKQYFKDKKYYVSLNLIASRITGDKEAILDQQCSSRRYFQRPDADYLTIDSNLTSLSGHGGTFEFTKTANSGLRYQFVFTWRSPGVELNDVGYLRAANNAFQYIWIGYNSSKTYGIFRKFSFNFNQWAGWDFGGTNIFKGGNMNFWTQFTNLWTIHGSIGGEFNSIDNTALRGGSALRYPSNINYNIGFGTNKTKKLSFSAGFFKNKNAENAGHAYGIFGSISYRPTNTLSFTILTDYMYRQNQLQYITQSTYEEINEERYLFASIEQKTLSLIARIDFSITPELTIQYYGSPFVSGGLFSDYKMITDGMAENYNDRFSIYGHNQLDFNDYMIDENLDGTNDYDFYNPNFNFRQFRSNLVVRWEYTPGSVFYVVWSQNNTDSIEEGEFDFSNDIKGLFSTTPHNVFLIKFQHRFRLDKWL